MFEAWYQKKEEEIFAKYFELLRFPSVSAQKAHASDVLACKDWVQKELEEIGFQTKVWEGSGYPVLFGEHIVDANAPTILFYGHYDVQPAEPFELWHSGPFKPEIRDGKVFARGAEDNKGQLFYTLSAIRAFLELVPKAPINLKMVIEGEEEMGSKTLEEVIPHHEKELKADHLLVVDMGMGSWNQPSLSIGARGIMAFQITCRNTNIDLHSGAFGGIVYNPLRALAEVLGRVIDKEGHIAIKGFYDDIVPLTEKEKKLVDLSFDPELFKEEGIVSYHYEKGFNPTEANFLRPTFEINGLWGGYTGEGFKTVIPKEAHAKISCRLVPDQNPDHVYEVVSEHLKREMPKGMHVSFERFSGGEAAWAKPTSKTVSIVREAYKQVFGSCELIYGGGSVPITALLARHSGAEYVLPGTGLDSNCIHAPNENFGLKQFYSGYLMIANTLRLFAEKSLS